MVTLRTSRRALQLAVDDWALERLLAFDADAAELEDQGDDEPDADGEVDRARFVIADVVPPKVIRRRQGVAPSFGKAS